MLPALCASAHDSLSEPKGCGSLRRALVVRQKPVARYQKRGALHLWLAAEIVGTYCTIGVADPQELLAFLDHFHVKAGNEVSP